MTVSKLPGTQSGAYGAVLHERTFDGSSIKDCLCRPRHYNHEAVRKLTSNEKLLQENNNSRGLRDRRAIHVVLVDVKDNKQSFGRRKSR